MILTLQWVSLKYDYVIYLNLSGIKAIEKYQENIKEKQIFISFATAHPGKFGETISKIISKKIENQKLLELLKKPTKCILLENDKDITTKLKTMIINTFL